MLHAIRPWAPVKSQRVSYLYAREELPWISCGASRTMLIGKKWAQFPARIEQYRALPSQGSERRNVHPRAMLVNKHREIIRI